MACRYLGEGTRLAATSGAWICFEDEAGQNLRPPKARTWARRGCTPVVAVSGKGSGRVSVAGLVCLKPDMRSRLLYRMRIHRGRKGERRSMSEADYAGLIAAAHHHLHAPVILIWDNLNTHISTVMRTFTTAHDDWLTVVRLPAYAPDLNPAEVERLRALHRLPAGYHNRHRWADDDTLTSSSQDKEPDTHAR